MKKDGVQESNIDLVSEAFSFESEDRKEDLFSCNLFEVLFKNKKTDVGEKEE